MRADKALAQQSGQRLIVADTRRGLVSIYRQAAPDALADSFHLRFVPRDTDSRLNGTGTVVGSYDDLDTALTIAALGYGVSETEWMPMSEEELLRAASGEHSPVVEGRQISHEDHAVKHTERKD